MLLAIFFISLFCSIPFVVELKDRTM